MAGKKREPINKPVAHDPRTYVDFAVPGGAKSFWLTAEQLAKYNADPDQYVADHLGLHVEDYRDYILLDGAPGCGAKVKSASYCRNTVGQIQQRVDDFKRRHRQVFCHVHRSQENGGR